ncbi:uncharacterized protein F4822DRAFT_440929 [Hypoxylon trugodes]|uniref:uncharacterized protein n=1 Tax=Hypoxylon trugodes TaxID=326681 RepID=UPI00219A4DFD|nr:uncharacterized protein F4822DRAFT_440929 [Hypoxylon trugodes]KAI1382619.1 hypothetical protein F4822DRAFT_440929 [Hypoxylon trugodes]
MKHFVEAVWRGTKGVLDKENGMATPSSIRNKIRRFYGAWERENHTTLPAEVKDSLAPFIKGELKDKVGAKSHQARYDISNNKELRSHAGTSLVL